MQNVILLVATSLAISGCAIAPPPARLLAVSDSRAKVPALHAPDASAGTVTFRPVGPTGWGGPATAPKPTGAKP